MYKLSQNVSDKIAEMIGMNTFCPFCSNSKSFTPGFLG